MTASGKRGFKARHSFGTAGLSPVVVVVAVHADPVISPPRPLPLGGAHGVHSAATGPPTPRTHPRGDPGNIFSKAWPPRKHGQGAGGGSGGHGERNITPFPIESTGNSQPATVRLTPTPTPNVTLFSNEPRPPWRRCSGGCGCGRTEQPSRRFRRGVFRHSFPDDGCLSGPAWPTLLVLEKLSCAREFSPDVSGRGRRPASWGSFPL